MAVTDRQTAARVAREWLDAFNAHRADLIVEHFATDVSATSPVIARLLPESGGTLHGKADVRSYYEEGLRLSPDLHFTLVEVLRGVDQVTIVYRNQRDVMVAETLTFGRDDTVQAVHVTYGETPVTYGETPVA